MLERASGPVLFAMSRDCGYMDTAC
jgi:hypothetical protein